MKNFNFNQDSLRRGLDTPPCELRTLKNTKTHPLWRYAAMITLLLTLACGQMWGTDITFSGSYDGTGEGSWNTTTSTTPIVTVTKDFGGASKAISCVNASKLSYPSINGSAKYIKFAVPSGYRITNVNVTWVSNVESQNIIAIFGDSLSGPTSNVVTASSKGGYVVSATLATSGNSTCDGGEDFAISSSYNAKEVMLVRQMAYDATLFSSASTNYSDFACYLGSAQKKTYTTAVGKGNTFYIGKVVLTVEPTTTTKYTLAYDANGGSGSMPAHDFVSGTTVYAGQNAGFTPPTGKIFKCWNTQANGEGTEYKEGAYFTLSANTTLYAQWITASTSDTYCISMYNLSPSDEMKYFTYSGYDDMQILDLEVPNYNTGGDNFWVGKGGSWKTGNLGNSGASSANERLENLCLKGNRTQKLGTGSQGVLARFFVYDNSTYNNIYIEFSPKQYSLIWGEEGKSWDPVKLYPSGCENEWTSEVVSLTSDHISNDDWKYYVGIMKADDGVAFWYKSKTSIVSSMGTYNKTTDTWGGNVSTLSAGDKGFFRMWQDATDYDNWRCHFVPVYTLSYNANGGSGAPANAYVATEGDAAVRTLKVSTTEPTRNGYSFEGWAENSANASAGTVDYAPGASITLSADQELWAVWKCVDPTITTDLSEDEVDYYVGVSATALTVAATAAGGSVSYQWYSNDEKNTTTPTTLTTGASYTPSTAAAGTTYYYCVVTNSTAGCSTTTTSSIAKIVVSRQDPTTQTFSAASTSICSGSDATFTLASSQVGATYYLTKANGGGSAIGDSKAGTGSALTFTATSATTGDYYCWTSQTTAFNAKKVSKSKVTISYKTATSVTVDDATLDDAVVDEEYTISGITGAGAGTLYYQWYSYSDDEGSDETAIVGADEDTYAFTPDTEGNYYFKCKVTGDCGSVKSELITVTASPGCDDPSASLSDGAYTIGGSALDLRTLWSSSNTTDGVTFSITSGTGTIAGDGYTFSSSTAGSVTISASQTSTGAYCDAAETATITVSNPTYTVTYTTTGSTGGIAPTDSNSPYESGSTVTVLGNTGSLVKTGHVFLGWSDGNSNNYAPGETFTISANTTLSPIWKEGTSATVTYTLATGNVAWSASGASSETTSIPNAGVTITTTNAGISGNGAGEGAKARTSKLTIATGANGATYDSPTYYILYNFSVAAGYAFTPSDIAIKVANIGSKSKNNIKYKAVLSDGTHSISTTYIVATQDGTVETFHLYNKNAVVFEGDVELKIWAWTIEDKTDGGSGFRFGSPLTIAGVTESTCDPITATASAGTASVTGKTTANLPYTLSNTTNVASVTIKVYDDEDNLVETIEDLAAATSGSGSATGLSAGTTYTYTVTPIGESGYCDGSESSASSAFTTQYGVTYAAGVTLTSGSVPTDANGYTSGANATVLGNTGNMVYGSEIFLGWTDGTTFYVADNKFTIATNTTLTAVWSGSCSASGSSSYNVTLAADGTNKLKTWQSATDSCLVEAKTSNDAQKTYVKLSANDKLAFYIWKKNASIDSVKVDMHTTTSCNTPNATTKFLPTSGTSVTGYTVTVSNDTMYIQTSSLKYVNTTTVYYRVASGSTCFDVTFADGSVTPDSHTTWPDNLEGVPSGKKIVQPADPTTEDDYVFGGWYSDAACTADNEINWSTMTITADKTIYAKWCVSHTVAWEVNGSEYDTGDPTTATTNCDGITTMPTAPADNTLSCANSFRGWSATNLYGEAVAKHPMDLFVNAADAPTIDADKTFYAVFGTATDKALVGTVMWSEDWTGATTATSANDDAAPSGQGSHSGQVVYSGSVTYTETTNGTFVRNDNTGGGTAPELFVKSSEAWTIAGIPSGGADSLILSYKRNDATLTPSVSGDGYSISSKISGSGKGTYVYYIKCGSGSTFNLTFTAGSSNVRLDDIVVKVKRDGATNYRCSCPSLSVLPKLVTKGTPIFITSAASKTVRSQDTLHIVGTGLAKSATLTLKDLSPKFVLKSATNGAISTDETGAIDTVAYIYYTPDAEDDEDGLDKNNSFTISDGTNDVPVNTALIGRHLPANFVIAAKSGDKWYALPANMANSDADSRRAPVEIIVNNTTTPDTATTSEANVYSLYGQTSAVINGGNGHTTRLEMHGIAPTGGSGHAPLFGSTGNTLGQSGNATLGGDLTAGWWWILTQTNTSVSALTDVKYNIKVANGNARPITLYNDAEKWGLYASGTKNVQEIRLIPWVCTAIDPSLTYSKTTIWMDDATLTATPTLDKDGSTGSVTYELTSATPSGCVTLNTSTGVVTAVKRGTATITATIADDGTHCSNSATCNITVKDTECEYVEIAGVTLTAKNAGTPSGSLIASSSGYVVSCQKWENPDGGCGTGAKLGAAGNYVCLTLKSGESFQNGDKVILDIAKVPDVGDGKLHIYAGTSSAGTQLGEEASPVCGENEIILSGISSSTPSITLYRTDGDDAQNPYVVSMKVYRYGCPDIFIYDDAAGTHEWSNEDNWIGATGHGSGLPTSEDRVFINESVTVDTEDAAAAEIHITNGSMVTVEKPITVGDVIIETGSTLNIAKDDEDGITVATNSLYLRGGWNDSYTTYDMPRVYIDPASTLTKVVNTVNFDISVDSRNYYPFAVPFKVKVKDVNYANSTLAYYSNYGPTGQYVIKEYDGARRAENGPDRVNNWKVVPQKDTKNADVYLEPGRGYIMTAVSLPAYGGGVIRIPLEFDNAWTAEGEQGTVDEVTKNVVAVTAHVKEAGDTKNANKGWNMMGVPFMSCYATSAAMYAGEGAAAVMQGKYDFNTGNWTENNIRYVSVPMHDFSEYIQRDITESGTILLPGWCFFIQIETSGNLTFLTTKQAEESELPIYAPRRERAEMPVEKTGIILSGGEASDKTTILVSDKYSAADYEINADLEKMFGNGYTLATYSLSGETRLAYNAMSTSDATAVIPIGYRAPAEGEYTFSINPRYAESGAFSRVDLIDYETSTVTNLLYGPYTFESDRTQNDARFALNVVMAPQTPTDIESISDEGLEMSGAHKMIIDEKLYIILDGKMYDATGKVVKGGKK